MKYPIVDLHTHSHMKGYMWDRDIGEDPSWISKLFHKKFWPFSSRSDLDDMFIGDVSVALMTTHILEKPWLDDVPLVKFLSKFSKPFKERILEPSYFDSTIGMMNYLEDQVANEKDFFIARCAKDIKTRGDRIALVHSVEGGHSLEGNEGTQEEIIKNLFTLADLGMAYLTLAHFYPNKLVEPVFPYPETEKKHIKDWDTFEVLCSPEGLTGIGTAVVEEMLSNGIFIDVSHCTPQARKEIYLMAAGRENALIASHVGVQQCHRLNYNLADWELKKFADNGWGVGIIFMNYWLTPHTTGQGLKFIEGTLDHIMNVCGEEVACIGSDFDGFTDPPDDMRGADEYGRLTRYLECMGYSDKQILRFTSQNAYRILTDGWTYEKK